MGWIFSALMQIKHPSRKIGHSEMQGNSTWD